MVFMCLGSQAYSKSGKDRTSADYPEWEYTKIKRELKKGWNTWDVRSIFNLVWVEEQLGVKITFYDSKRGEECERIQIGENGEEMAAVRPYHHSYDGYYIEADATWYDTSVKLRCASEGKRLVVLLTPVSEGNTADIKVSPGKIWEAMYTIGSCSVNKDHFKFTTMFGTSELYGKVAGKNVRYVEDGSYYLCSSDAPVLIYTGEDITVEEAQKLMEDHKNEFERVGKEKWGDDYECYNAMQTVLAWDTFYDPSEAMIVTPVSRLWCLTSSAVSDVLGGYVLFDWDTYFASEMFAVDNRELAYCNAIEITKAVDKCGFVPNYRCSNDHVSYDRSQPPVGSRAIWMLYQKYGDRWLIEYLYPRLLRWNLWWDSSRKAEGLLCWGSTPPNGESMRDEVFGRKQAVLESGLDNTYVYDEAGYFADRHIASYIDVGLSSMYVMDCEYLAKIADELGYRKEAKQIRARGEEYGDNIQKLWSEEDGMFYCKDMKTGQLVKKMDPTNFYPLLCKAATQKQAERMVNEHLLNENEFWGDWVIPCSPRNTSAHKDNDYWRGRIWGPTNFLVYLGICNYDFPEVRKELAEKSKRLLMKEWLTHGYVYENWNSVTGEGGDVDNSTKFYHWGALMGYIHILENR